MAGRKNISGTPRHRDLEEGSEAISPRVFSDRHASPPADDCQPTLIHDTINPYNSEGKCKMRYLTPPKQRAA
ncbi:MAG: hypothetical protein FWC97_05020 [Treponema sp.]|nr:hypothetical protein [Treponema sp.]